MALGPVDLTRTPPATTSVLATMMVTGSRDNVGAGPPGTGLRSSPRRCAAGVFGTTGARGAAGFAAFGLALARPVALRVFDGFAGLRALAMRGKAAVDTKGLAPDDAGRRPSAPAGKPLL